MEEVFIEFVFLTLVILALVMLANKIKLAYPIVLVIGGLLLSLTSQFSNIRIEPGLVFFIFLPPLLYDASWQISWKVFWKWRRVITSFAFPIVIITSCAIALVSHLIIPGFTLALGFLLGGIISPPDAISATTIMRQVNAPRSLVTILEGESLLNDASSLIVFRFALAAVITGQFNLQQASVSFLLVIVMGILVGIVTGYAFYFIHLWLPTTSGIEIVLSLIAPYCMYYFAEHFHYSGVLAVVSGGLLLSGKRHNMLSFESRLQGTNVWTSLVFVLNGLIFMLIGLQLPAITRQLEDPGVGMAIFYGLAISAALILSRLLCTFGAMAWTVFISRFITVADATPGWRTPLVAGWAGMRGVVSLGAALSIPLLLPTGEAFPHRNLILFITFIVILVTLVLQGLTLPWLIRKVKLQSRFKTIPVEKQEAIIQKKISQYSLNYLDEQHGGNAGNEFVNNLRARLQLDVVHFDHEMSGEAFPELDQFKQFKAIYLGLLEKRRTLLRQMNHHENFDEEIIRKYQALIDVEEFKVREAG
jgi:CPA1 family monovalent cation:H+ antiporter